MYGNFSFFRILYLLCDLYTYIQLFIRLDPEENAWSFSKYRNLMKKNLLTAILYHGTWMACLIGTNVTVMNIRAGGPDLIETNMRNATAGVIIGVLFGLFFLWWPRYKYICTGILSVGSFICYFIPFDFPMNGIVTKAAMSCNFSLVKTSLQDIYRSNEKKYLYLSASALSRISSVLLSLVCVLEECVQNLTPSGGLFFCHIINLFDGICLIILQYTIKKPQRDEVIELQATN